MRFEHPGDREEFPAAQQGAFPQWQMLSVSAEGSVPQAIIYAVGKGSLPMEGELDRHASRQVGVRYDEWNENMGGEKRTRVSMTLVRT